MRTITAFIRLVLIIVWTIPLQLIRLVYGRFAPDEITDRRWRRWWFRLWAKGVVRIAGVRVVTHGAVPQPPCIVVANHLSYFDVVALIAQTGFVFVAMSDMAQWPVIGPIAKSLFVVFVDRKDKTKTGEALPQIQRTLELGDGLVIFPEGGISRGIDVNPFRSPLVEPAIAAGKPVCCATLHYESAPGDPPANRIIGWWRPEPLGEHIFRVLKYPGSTTTIHYSVVDPAGMDRKLLAAALHAEVMKTFVPMP